MEGVLSMGDDSTRKVTRVGWSKFVFLLDQGVDETFSVQ